MTLAWPSHGYIELQLSLFLNLRASRGTQENPTRLYHRVHCPLDNYAVLVSVRFPESSTFCTFASVLASRSMGKQMVQGLSFLFRLLALPFALVFTYEQVGLWKHSPLSVMISKSGTLALRSVPLTSSFSFGYWNRSRSG